MWIIQIWIAQEDRPYPLPFTLITGREVLGSPAKYSCSSISELETAPLLFGRTSFPAA